MPRTIAADCPGCPPIRALTFDVLGLIKVIEARSNDNSGLPTTPHIVQRWGEPDASRCILSASINDRKLNPLLAIARKNGHIELLNPLNGDVRASIITENAIEEPIAGLHLFKKERLDSSARTSTLLTCTTKGNAALRSIEVANNPEDSVCSDSPTTWSVCGSGDILCSAVNGNESHALFAGKGVEVNLWDLENHTKLWAAKPPPKNSLGIFTPTWFTSATFLDKEDHRTIVAGTNSHQVRLYDVSAQRRPVITSDFRESPIRAVTADLDGHTIYFGTGSGDLASIDIRTGKLLGCFLGKCSGGIISILRHPELPLILSCGLDRYLRVWDVKTRQLLSAVFLKQHLTNVVIDSNFSSEDSSTREAPTDRQTAVGYNQNVVLLSEEDMKLQHVSEIRVGRLHAIISRLHFAGILPERCILASAREVSQEELEVVHSQDYIEYVEHSRSMPSSSSVGRLYAYENSALAARLSAGICAELAKCIMVGRFKNAFALVTPPGNLAGPEQAMALSQYNNAAVAALAALNSDATKVLIVDWGVQHGCGTQAIFNACTSVLYISLHRHEDGRFSLGTGAANEVGAVGSEGYTINIPWKCAGIGDEDYIFAFQQIVLPIASQFTPDFTIISAGFDAARGDSFGCCDVTPDGFARMTHLLSGLSEGRMLVILEGGYDLPSLSASIIAVIKVLLGEFDHQEVSDLNPSNHGLETVVEVLKIQAKFWPNLKSNLTRLLSDFPEEFPHNQDTGFSAARGYQHGSSPRHQQVPSVMDNYIGRQAYQADIAEIYRRMNSLRPNRGSPLRTSEPAPSFADTNERGREESLKKEILRAVKSFKTDVMLVVGSSIATALVEICKNRKLLWGFIAFATVFVAHSAFTNYQMVKDAKDKLVRGRTGDDLDEKKKFAHLQIRLMCAYIFLAVLNFVVHGFYKCDHGEHAHTMECRDM